MEINRTDRCRVFCQRLDMPPVYYTGVGFACIGWAISNKGEARLDKKPKTQPQKTRMGHLRAFVLSTTDGPVLMLPARLWGTLLRPGGGQKTALARIESKEERPCQERKAPHFRSRCSTKGT